MNTNNITFPHPILRIGDDSIGSTINPSLPVTTSSPDADFYKTEVTFLHNNDDLLKLINSGKAEYLCEATCTNTVFRQVFTSKTENIVFEIPKKKVKGRVEFTCLLVATEDIENYSNANAHSDYSGYTFDIDKGDILAHFGESYFSADIQYEKLKAVSSFMGIVENETEKYTIIDLKKSKIEIQLPTESYNLYRSGSISQEEKFAPIFHSSIVLNALLIALYNFEEHKDYLWAQVIDYRLQTEPQFKTLSIEDKENIPEIAQRLLGNPFERLLNGLNNVVEIQNEE